MSLTKNEVLNFSEFCKENNYFIPIDQLKTFFEYKNLKNIKNLNTELRYLYFLIPKSRDEQIYFKSLINRYFKYSIETNDSTSYSLLNEYSNEDNNLYEIISDLNNGNIENFNSLVKGVVESFGDIDYSRPVSNDYWLNQIKKSIKYQETMLLFSNYEFDEISFITNLINKNKFNSLLDMKILEILNDERNKAKDPYQPSELEPKTQIGELDFLYSDPNERRLLLEQTYKLGNKLAIKFKRHIKQASKGKLHFRKTIRKSMQTGGIFQKIIMRPKILRKPSLVIVCDISGSMALYSLFGITLLFGMVSRFRSIKAFVFIDGLTEVTKTLKNLKKNEIDSVLHNWNSYVKSDGHSDYEKSFQELVDENKKINSTTKSLIVIGDGRNNYRNISEDVINNLHNQFENIYWMNPEKKKYWNTGDSQIRKFEKITYMTSEVRNYNQLRDFVNNIDFRKILK
ncbi:MAG: VWA domain-containing protein [Actinomycetota bacterium]|nr:VWA domain-containing protein [Actinomycetota bacterium]